MSDPFGVPFSLEVLGAWEVTRLPEPPVSDLLLGPLVVRGHRTIVVGDTGHGKTTLALQLVAAIVHRREALGYTGAGNVRGLVIDLEQGLKSVKRSLREAGLADSELVDYARVPDGLSLDSDTAQMAELERAIGAGGYGVVVLDPFYKAHDGDSNDEQAIKRLMARLDGLRSRFDFALILPAHPRKEVAGRAGARVLTLHDVAGSGAITRGAEIVLAIERVSHGYARLRILKDRDGDLSVGEAWPVIFERGDGFKLDPKEQHTEEELEARVLADVEAGALRTVNEWAAELGIRKTRAKSLLEGLAETGRIDAVPGNAVGRSAKAALYGTGPEGWGQSGPVNLSLLDSATGPTGPDGLLGTVDNGDSQTSGPASGPVEGVAT